MSVHFYVRVIVNVRDRVHDLVRCGVRVSGRVRVRDSVCACFRCCFHVSVSGRNFVRCGVATCPWPSSIVSVTVPVSIAVSMSVTVSVVEFVSSVHARVSVSVSVSMSGPCPSVSNPVRVCFRVLAHVATNTCPCSWPCP